MPNRRAPRAIRDAHRPVRSRAAIRLPWLVVAPCRAPESFLLATLSMRPVRLASSLAAPVRGAPMPPANSRASGAKFLRVHTIAVHGAQCYAAPMTGAREFSASRPTVNSPTGVTMKMSISYKHVQAHRPVEAEVAHHVEKLNRLLKSYEPDLVQLHATGTAENPRSSCKVAFSELEGQLKKHQSILRKDHQWKRKRPIVKPSEK